MRRRIRTRVDTQRLITWLDNSTPHDTLLPSGLLPPSDSQEDDPDTTDPPHPSSTDIQLYTHNLPTRTPPPSTPRWEAVSQLVLEGREVTASLIPNHLTSLGIVATLVADSPLDRRWQTCCVCGREARHDVRHELFECKGGASACDGREIAKHIREIKGMLAPGLMEEGDCGSVTADTRHLALQHTLTLAIKALTGKAHIGC